MPNHSHSLGRVDGPDISIVIPSFNGEDFIADALRSVERQSIRERVELIVVDDASTDGTLDIVASVAPSARTEALPSNAGEAVARNVGLAMASGGWVTFLDQDDVLGRRHVEELLRMSEEYNAAIAPLSLRFATPENSLAGTADVRMLVEGEAAMLDELEAAMTMQPVSEPRPVDFNTATAGGVSNSVFAPKRLLIAAGGFPPYIRGVSDYLLLCELARLSCLFRSGVTTYGYRVHAQKASRRYSMAENILTARVLLATGSRDTWGGLAWDAELLSVLVSADDGVASTWTRSLDGLAFSQLLRLSARQRASAVRRSVRRRQRGTTKQ
jgi:glycosyltransferase involved in cell wall biosynthesis